MITENKKVIATFKYSVRVKIKVNLALIVIEKSGYLSFRSLFSEFIQKQLIK